MCVLHNLLEVGAGTKHGLAQRAGGGSIVHHPQHHRNQLRWNSDEEKSFAKCVKWTPSNSKPMSLETLNILLYYFFSCTSCINRIQQICTFMALPSWNTSADWEGCYLLILCTVGDQPTHPTLTRCRVHFWSLQREVRKIHKVQAFIPRCIVLRQKSHGVQSGLQTFLILTLSYNSPWHSFFSPRHSGIPTLWNQLCVAVH